MKKEINPAMNIFGIISGALLLLANLSYSFWTVWLVLEQIETGWGFSTKMEMFVLAPCLHSICLIPIFVVGLVYLLLHIKERSRLWVFIPNISLLSLLVLQHLINALFVFY